MAIFLQVFLSTILLSQVFATPTSTTEPPPSTSSTFRPEKGLVLDTIEVKKSEDHTPKVSRPEIHITQPNEYKRSVQGELLLSRVAGKCDVFKTEDGEEVQLVNADLRKPKFCNMMGCFRNSDEFRSWNPSSLDPWTTFRSNPGITHRNDMSTSEDLEEWEVYWLEIYNRWLYAQMAGSGSGSGSNSNERNWEDHHYHEHVPSDAEQKPKTKTDQRRK